MNENDNDKRATWGARRAPLLCALGTAALVALAGCGPVHLVANTNIPTPLITKLPIGVALFIPADFSNYVHEEERWNTDWQVELGKAQTEGITRLMNAMFERVVKVDSVNAAKGLGGDIRAILEPSIEEYAFVTPRDAGSPFFAVSIKYRVNVYLPDGKLADSWGFTGYGTSPSEGLSSEAPLAAATALAMRDAGAKLAVEFREQAVVRGLLPQSESADSPAKVISNLPALTTPAVAPLPPASGAGPAGTAGAPVPGDSGSSDQSGAGQTGTDRAQPGQAGPPSQVVAPPPSSNEALPQEPAPKDDEATPKDDGGPPQDGATPGNEEGDNEDSEQSSPPAPQSLVTLPA